MAVCSVPVQIDTREHREEIFGKVADMENKVAIAAPIDRAQLDKHPEYIEKSLREEFLVEYHDMGQALINARRIIGKNDNYYKGIAFGSEMKPPRDLAWLHTVKKHVAKSLGRAPPDQSPLGLWAYDLDQAVARFNFILQDIGIKVKPSIQRDKDIRLMYFDPFLMCMTYGVAPKEQKLTLTNDLHMAMLKTYKALLAITFSLDRKKFTVKTVEDMRTRKRLREEGGFSMPTYTIAGIGWNTN